MAATVAGLQQQRLTGSVIHETELPESRHSPPAPHAALLTTNRQGTGTVQRYPNTEPGPGISPWFKVGLIDTYHMGIKVGLGWHGLVKCEGGLRKANYKSGERDEVTAMLTGEIPYDYIETMNPSGDEYYYFPHIFCHFANRGEPYARLFYTQEVDMGHGHSYWKEIAPY